MISKNLHHPFHKMFCSPSVARQCIQTFEGHSALFLPSSYRFLVTPNMAEDTTNTEDRAMAASNRRSSPSFLKLSAYETCYMLNLVTYYALVLLSLTGVSTLLGMTDTIQCHEYEHPGVKVWPLSPPPPPPAPPREEQEDHPPPPNKKNVSSSSVMSTRTSWKHMESKRVPEIQIHPLIFEYLQTFNVDVLGPKTRSFWLKRKYEFHFRLVGLHVIMLHLAQEEDSGSTCGTSSRSSSSKAKRPPKTEEEQLHLVEVYHFSNPIVRWVMEMIFTCLRVAFDFIQGYGVFLDSSSSRRRREQGEEIITLYLWVALLLFLFWNFCWGFHFIFWERDT